MGERPGPVPGAGGAGPPPSPDAGAIRPARPSDLGEIVRIERASFPLPWSRLAFRSVMAREDARVLVAERDGRVAGYAALWAADGGVELADLAVHPEARRRGVGRALLEATLEAARDQGADVLFLQVRESNEAALALYRSQGFRRVGRRPGYYRSPREDGLMLARRTGDAGGRS